MPRPKNKQIQHDEIVSRFGQRLRELRVTRGMSQAELARQAQVTTNYVSKLENGGSACGIDLVARLAAALGVRVADLLPADPLPDEKAVIRQQAKRLFDSLVVSDDRELLMLLAQFLARLASTDR